jgi:hypothetical protein
MRPRKYSNEYIIGTAQNYRTVGDFRNAHPNLYLIGTKRGITGLATDGLGRKKCENRKLGKNQLFLSQVLGPYTLLSDRKKGSTRKSRGYWVPETIFEFAKGYFGTAAKFKRTGAGSAADRLGILKGATALLPMKKSPVRFWSPPPDKPLSLRFVGPPPPTMVCRTCDEEQPFDRFVNDRSARFGKERLCKRCNRATKKLKRARKPAWASDKAIAAIYAERDRLNALGDEVYEVDHIIPVNGELVTGLHHELNLQLLTRDENASKTNIFVPG